MTSLYTISQLSVTGSTFSAVITFNPSHAVFAGHFPGKPVVPGVVLIEISEAVVSLITGKYLTVKEASVIKFLQVIEPELHPVIRIEGSIIQQDSLTYTVDLQFTEGENVFAKLRRLKLVSE